MGGLLALLWSVAAIGLLFMYTKGKKEAGSGITEKEARQIEDLLDVADRLAERIKNLESILDVEVPDWRDEHGS